MAKSCGNGDVPGVAGDADGCPLTWFENQLDHCHDYALAAHESGRPIVGIMCEFTPRELILAAGAVPVCLCGGAAETIPAAEEDLPANLCPLIKSTYGYHKQRSNPFLEMACLVVAETTCDGKKKMYELMGRTRPMYVLELPQKCDDADARRHWLAELRKFKGELEHRLRVRITRPKLKAAIRVMNRERSVRRRLAGLMASPRPPLTGRQLLGLKTTIACMPDALEQYDRALAMLKGRQGSPESAGRVRVLMTGVPMVAGAERVLDIVENSGGLVVALENCTGLKPVLEDVDAGAGDLLAALAEKYFHLPCSVMTPNRRRLEMLEKLARKYRPQCVIELIWHACLTYDVESHLVRRFVQERLHLPYLVIQTDYSPSDSSRIAVRVEALFETVRANKPNPEPGTRRRQGGLVAPATRSPEH